MAWSDDGETPSACGVSGIVEGSHGLIESWSQFMPRSVDSYRPPGAP